MKTIKVKEMRQNLWGTLETVRKSVGKTNYFFFFNNHAKVSKSSLFKREHIKMQHKKEDITKLKTQNKKAIKKKSLCGIQDL